MLIEIIRSRQCSKQRDEGQKSKVEKLNYNWTDTDYCFGSAY